MEPLVFDPNDPDIRRFSTQSARRPVVDSTDPYIRRVVDASRARAQAARAAAAGPALAASVPLTENPAPVATSAAASNPSLGSRLFSGARTLARGAAGAYGVGTAAAALAESAANDPAAGTTEQEAVARGEGVRSAMRAILPFGTGALERFIPEENTADLGRASERAVGFLKNWAGAGIAPVADAAFPPAAPVPAPGGVPAAPVSTAAKAEPAPEPITSGAAFIPPVFRGTAYSALPPKPVLSTEGGIFSALAGYQQQVSDYALATAERNRRQRAELGMAEVNNRAAAEFNKVLGDEEARAIDARKVAAVEKTNALKAQLDAAIKGKEVVQDALGNVVLVDKAKGTADKITPREKPTYQQFKDAALKDPRNKGASEADLKAAFDRYYGSR